MNSYDELGRRDSFIREGAEQPEWAFAYNGKSEIIGAGQWMTTVAGTTSTRSPKVRAHYSYGYDQIGNRLSVKSEGSWPAGTTVSDARAAWVAGEGASNIPDLTETIGRFYYETTDGSTSAQAGTDSLNRYLSIRTGQATEVSGVSSVANPAISIQVNNSVTYSAQVQGLHNFSQRTSGSIGGTYSWKTKSTRVIQNGTSLKVGTTIVPPFSATLVYDDDGNLTQWGDWTLGWNAENRLISVTTPGTTSNTLYQIGYSYDALGRRAEKRVLRPNPLDTYCGPLSPQQLASHCYTERYIYDGWNLVAILRQPGQPGATNPAPFVRRAEFVWSTDLSGTYQGAGGVGGLRALRFYDHAGAYHSTHMPGYDANGNIIGLVLVEKSSIVPVVTNPTQPGQLSARYDYTPFGVPVATVGGAGAGDDMKLDGISIAEMNPFRFSTKFTDEETGFIYYGYRYYSPDMGRWLNRDPIGETGGLNLYGFVRNNPLWFIDRNGLDLWEPTPSDTDIDGSPDNTGAPSYGNRSSDPSRGSNCTSYAANDCSPAPAWDPYDHILQERNCKQKDEWESCDACESEIYLYIPDGDFNKYHVVGTEHHSDGSDTYGQQLGTDGVTSSGASTPDSAAQDYYDSQTDWFNKDPVNVKEVPRKKYCCEK